MKNRLVALTVLAAIALPSVAEAGALCGGKRGYGYSAPRFETSVRVNRATPVRIVREERVALRPQATPVRTAETEQTVDTVTDTTAPVETVVAVLSGARAQGER